MSIGIRSTTSATVMELLADLDTHDVVIGDRFAGTGIMRRYRHGDYARYTHRPHLERWCDLIQPM